jgi:hypothetical protein
MTGYTIERAPESVPLVGDVSGTVWSEAESATIDSYPWDTGGDEQAATVRVLYDDEALYLQFQVEDTHSSASVSWLNGPVYRDSCVEWFFAPGRDRTPYFNFEINCIGTYILGWGRDRNRRMRVPRSLADLISVETAIEGTHKSPAPEDDQWWVAVSLPFETLAAFSGRDIAPTAGTVWTGNFQRLGGDSELAAWSNIDTVAPEFHSPASFEELTFG